VTRAPGPAGHEPDGSNGTDGTALTRAPRTSVPGPAADAPTVALPVAGPVVDAVVDAADRAAPAVPEVPAIGDLAAPGRPDVDAVVEAAGEPARRRPRPSRHMRARADEMARLLARATPSRRTRRSLSSLPAVAAVMGAVAVGGVGIALGLDAQRTGVALPDVPDVPAEQTPVPETGDGTAGPVAAAPTVNTGIVEALEPDAGETRRASPSSVAAEARPTPAPAGPPRATTPTSRPRATTSPTTSTRAEPTTGTSSPTPRSTSSPRPTTQSDATDGAGQRSAADDDGPDGLGDEPTTGPPLDDGNATAN
jgi:hypothetical protein